MEKVPRLCVPAEVVNEREGMIPKSTGLLLTTLTASRTFLTLIDTGGPGKRWIFQVAALPSSGSEEKRQENRV
jgi:hypothetical protein